VYELVPASTKGDETGKVKAGETIEVTYVYKEITGNVVVHYVDTEGNTLAADTKDVENGSLSEKYDTTDNKPEKIEKDGTVYYLTAKELKEGSKPENGAVVEGTTEISYVYEKAGQVVVHYVDEAGNTIQADVVGTKDGKPGAAYNTMDKDVKPTRITTPEGRVYELVPTSTKGNENGSVEAGKTTEVTYVYKEIKGNVVVRYVDEAGNTIAEDVKDTTDGSINSAYDTTDNKLATITTKDGKKYVLVPTATKGAETGKVTEGTTEVTYVYKEIKEEKPGQTPGNPGEKPGQTPGNPGENPGTPGTPNTPEKPMDPNSPAKPEGERSPVDVVKSQFKRLANTGNETTNTAAAGFGALIAGIAVAVRRRQRKDK
ncbi:MAG: MucBP domain-containing protein, partial [Staphylococcus aureus]|nr:MucBP domain-containing protein [Staphylococcus aureus]